MQGQDGSRLYGSGAIVPRLEAATGRIIDVVVPDEASPDLPGACSATEPDRAAPVERKARAFPDYPACQMFEQAISEAVPARRTR